MSAPTTIAGRFAAEPRRPAPEIEACCGGARVIDFAICLILAVTVVGLLLAAL